MNDMNAVLEVDSRFEPDAACKRSLWKPSQPLPQPTIMLWFSQCSMGALFKQGKRLNRDEVIAAVERWLTENSIASWGSIPPDPFPFPIAPPPAGSKATSTEDGGFMLVSDMKLEGDDLGLMIYVRDLAIFLARELKLQRVGFQIGGGRIQFLSATDHTELPQLKLRKSLETHDPNSRTRWARLLQLLGSRPGHALLQLLSLVL
jgi:hypothetical protein